MYLESNYNFGKYFSNTVKYSHVFTASLGFCLCDLKIIFP